MSTQTPYFDLYKREETDSYDIEKYNDNLDIIDTEMHKPPLTVNLQEPDSSRNIDITTVPLADNLTSDEAQLNTGTYIIRTSGGEASISDGEASLSVILGNMEKTGYVAESISPSVVGDISITIDHDTFVAYVTSSSTITLTYTTGWSADPANYGITVTGTPTNGDSITIVYVKENRGTITTASPTSFISTGWNLYNHTAGYARVINYSSEYGFMINGTYTALQFSESLSGERTTVTPVNGYFVVPSDGYVFVTGGNSTDTEIWMTWSDWVDEPNGGVFEAYTQSTIDLSGLMVSFPDGLMKVGNYADEINLNTQSAVSRITKMAYSDENLATVIASGVPYDTDTNYIYAVRAYPVTYSISLSGDYTVSDHGMEMFLGTTVPLTATSIYGQDLKGKLRRDVLTISQQSLTSTQQAQARTNIGAASESSVALIGTVRSIVLGSSQKLLTVADDDTLCPVGVTIVDVVTTNDTSDLPAASYKYGKAIVEKYASHRIVVTLRSVVNNFDAIVNKMDSSATWLGWKRETYHVEFTVNASSSKQITLENNSRIEVMTFGGSSTVCGRFEVFTSSTGSVVASTPTATNISVNTSTANKITISNANSSVNVIIKMIVFNGSAK